MVPSHFRVVKRLEQHCGYDPSGNIGSYLFLHSTARLDERRAEAEGSQTEMAVHIGLIGGGNISSTHARATRAIPGVEIVAVFGRNTEKVNRLSVEHRSVPYLDLNEFLSHRPMEMVIIGSPSGMHALQGIAAARRGLHVLVEKPIDVCTNQADALIAACDDAGVRCGVIFQEHFQPGILRLKQLIDDGSLGRLFFADAQVNWYRPPEYYSKSSWHGVRALDGGGALMNQGVHTVDLLLWLLGDVANVRGIL